MSDWELEKLEKWMDDQEELSDEEKRRIYREESDRMEDEEESRGLL